MRILVNAISARRGGIITYTENLIETLRARGVDAIFAVPSEIAASYPDNTVAITSGDFRPLKRLLWEQALWRRRVREFAPDILFSSANFGLFRSPVPQVLLLREGGLFDPNYLTNIAPQQGARIAIWRHCRRRLMLESAKHADHVITPSEAMRDLVVRWAPGIADRCTANPYGTPPGLFRPNRCPRPWRSDGTLRLLFVSVYYPHKNPSVLCSAIERLRNDGMDARATITMDIEETKTPGGALDRLVMERMSGSGLLDLGHRHYRDLPDLYRGHDVFVFPSVSETFGHPMAEALGSGLPIVAADTRINREICGEAALYFQPFSTADLASRVRALDADPELRVRLRATALERAKALYNWEDHVDRLIDIFEASVRGRHDRARGRRPA